MTRVAEGLREEHSSFVNFPAGPSAVAGQARSKPKQAPRKVCLLVLGTHHSGASAFARVLNLLGCELPKSVAQPNEAARATGGELGESDAIRQLNDRILASAGTRWDDWLEFPPNWLQSPTAMEFRDEALELLRQELSTAEIARRLVLTQATVRSHVAAILHKLDVPDRTGAVARAFRLGLIR